MCDLTEQDIRAILNAHCIHDAQVAIARTDGRSWLDNMEDAMFNQPVYERPDWGYIMQWRGYVAYVSRSGFMRVGCIAATREKWDMLPDKFIAKVAGRNLYGYDAGRPAVDTWRVFKPAYMEICDRLEGK